MSAIGRIILGSFLSALAGLAVLTAFPLGAYLLRKDDDPSNEIASFMILPIVASYFIFVVWVIALLPLYCLVPPDSPLWRWPICTFCGAVAGGAIMLVFCALLPGDLIDSLPLVGLAVLVGSVTCLFGSLTRGYFRFPSQA